MSRLIRDAPAADLRQVVERAPDKALRRIVEHAPDDQLQRIVEHAPDDHLQRIVDNAPAGHLERVVGKLGERAPKVRLPGDVRPPLRAPVGHGFPLDHLPEDRSRELAIVRTADLVVMRVGFVGLERAAGNAPALQPAGDGPHLLVATLPPQHLLEEAFVLVAKGDEITDERIRVRPGRIEPPGPGDIAERAQVHELARAERLRTIVAEPEFSTRLTAVPAVRKLGLFEPLRRGELRAALERRDVPGPPPVRAQLAGRSRLVFEVPADAEPIPLTVEGLLQAMSRFELRLPAAVANAKPPPMFLPLHLLAEKIGLAARPPKAEAHEASPFGALLSARRLASVRSGMLSRPSWVDVAGVVEFAQPPRPANPAPDETAIELPHRLLIAPDKGAGWAHATTPTEVEGRVELWTSRLGQRRPDGTVDESPSARRTFRAVWTRDYDLQPRNDDDPFRSSLTVDDRHQIVHMTSDAALKLKNGDEYTPVPVHAETLALSSLGAWLDSLGRWEDPPPVGMSLLLWRHRASMGRDTEVRVVKAGLLASFPFPAAFITVTDRRFHPYLDGNPAYLRKQFFVAIRVPEITLGKSGIVYDGPDASRHGESFDRQLPFSRARTITQITPALDVPEGLDPDRPDEPVLFWPKVGGEPVRFAVQAFDRDGREAPFNLPLLYVDKAYLEHDPRTALDRLAAAYDAAPAEWRTIDGGGRVLGYAPSARPDDTAFATRAIHLGVGVPGTEALKNAPDPPFVPVMRSADVDVPSLKQFAPEAARMEVTYHGAFLRGGFGGEGAGSGEVFLESVREVDLSFDRQAENSGGFLTPNFAINGLSRRLGPVGGDLAKLQAGHVDYKAVFEKLGAKLFGAINLWELLDDAVGVDDALPRFAGQALDGAQAFLLSLDQLKVEAGRAAVELGDLEGLSDQTIAAFQQILAGEEPPELEALLQKLKGPLEQLASRHATSADATARRVARRAADLARQLGDVERFARQLADLARGVEMASSAHAKLEWRPKLKKSSIFEPRGGSELVLAVEVAPDSSGGGAPESSVSCLLREFDLDLGPMRLVFEKVELSLEPGQKPDVDVRLREVRFEDELSFVQTLTEILPLNAFSDPPDLTVTEDGITASFSTGVPSVAVGVLSLQDLSLAAAARVPLAGESPLSVRFDFCTPQRPAALTVMMFGGAAYFGVEIAPLGENPLVALRGAFEFGASVSMNFGVASGGILVRAGIYFEARADGSVSLSGYFRARGEVQVLGLVSASIELRLVLTYESASGKCKGRATLEIEIEIAWFSTTVTLECEREFAGGNADPTFLEVMRPEDDYDPWTEYCEAFA